MINAADVYSVLDIKDNLFLSTDGAICVCYVLNNPEPYSLDKNKLDIRHSEFIKAFKSIVKDVYVHRQDVVIEKEYDANRHYWRDSYLTQSDFRHFNGRKTIEHYSVLTYTLGNLASLEKAYISNPLNYKEKLTKEDTEIINNFFECIENSISIINRIFNTTATPFQEEELKYYIHNYVNGFHEDNGCRDLYFENKLFIGEKYYSVFSISDSNYLPDKTDFVVDDISLKNKDNPLKTGFMDDFGVLFKENHIYNQIIHFEGHDKIMDELEKRVDDYKRHKSFSKRLNSQYEKLNQTTQKIIDDGAILCKCHINIFTWSDTKEDLVLKEKKVKAILGFKEIRFYVPSFEGLANIFFGSILGRECKLSRDYLFISSLKTGLNFSLNYSFYQDDEDGVVFQDRLLQVPLRIDWWDEKKKKIPARNFCLFAPTGTGKSALILSIAQQFLEQKVKIVAVEFGRSFEQLTKVYPDISAHICYDSNTPLGINPFDLQNNVLTNDKLLSLTNIVLKFWRLSIQDKENIERKVAVTKTIEEYYKSNTGIKSFPNYYNFIKENHKEIFETQSISDKYFDVESFLHVCSQFLPGGIYENICSTNGDTENIILNKDLVVFELRSIKGDPFLVSVILSLLDDTIKEKVLNDKSVKAYLIFDEMAESQELVNRDSDETILKTVAFLYQGIRKENGGVGTIYQTPSQMPENNPYAESIIGNTQILAVMEGTEQVYSNIIKRFQIVNSEHIHLMKSLKNKFYGKNRYSEVFLRFKDSYATVVRLEFSKQKFCAYQTEGKVWAELKNNYDKNGNFEECINQYIIKKNGKI